MREYEVNNQIYIDIKDIRNECKTYCKGIRSNSQLIERKNIKDFVYGQVINDNLEVSEKLSKKFGSTFINKNAIQELFDSPEEIFPFAPSLIDDKDLVFFKDENGREYHVPMRGERTKDGIYFQAKAIMNLFQIKNLDSTVRRDHTSYQNNLDYKYFLVRSDDKTTKEMYLTYDGLMRVINTSRSGIGYKFKNWIDEIVFNSLWGTNKQKVETFKRVLNVDADHLKCIMDKSASNIACLYLIDLGMDENDKKIFKYGFTDNCHRRFKEHMKRYGDDIKLDAFILIPNLELSKAECEFKNATSRYRFIKDQDVELIALCNESYINIKNVFKMISDKYTGNMRNQIAQYESEIVQMRHSYEMKIAKLESIIELKDKELELKDKELQLKDKELEVKDRDIEILQLKLQLAKINQQLNHRLP